MDVDASSLSTDPEGQEELLLALRKPRVGQVLRLGRPIHVAGWPPLRNLRVTERNSSAVRLRLWPDEGETVPPAPTDRAPSGARSAHRRPGAVPTLHCKVLYQDTGEEFAALRLLSVLNARWAWEKLILFGVPVHCVPYGAELLKEGLVLLEEPQGVTLGELKRRCGEHTRTRVADYLGREEPKLAVLAATCAAMLAASYVLGASAGDGDTLRLLPDGCLLRTDLVHLFGRGALLDAPPVWLPKAVTCALGGRWPDVQHMALVAFQVAMEALSPLPPSSPRLVRSWAQAQTLLLRMEQLLQLPATEYLSSLSMAEFQSALTVADDTLGKRVSSVLHDFFGYRPSNGDLDDQRTPEQQAKAQNLKQFLMAEEREAFASSLSLLWFPYTVTCHAWPFAVRIVAALSGDAERMLRLHCEDLLLLARQVNGAAVLRPRLDCPDAMNSLVANE
ncbi:unnamed protein product [Durusdinium trenchii]|uniref:Anaphase-promoting complex subunit 1 n=1 Tax=Durusdinium trenchii TaxID=1381693 RepID=A0ABP0HZV2_9DINO